MDKDTRAKWAADAALLTELVGSQGWDRFVEYLGKEEYDCTEHLISTGNNADFTRGYILGLRKAADIPLRIIETMRTLHAQENGHLREPR